MRYRVRDGMYDDNDDQLASDVWDESTQKKFSPRIQLVALSQIVSLSSILKRTFIMFKSFH